MKDKSYKTVYHPRQPEASALWRLLNNHYEGFEQCYEERFEGNYGFFRRVIGQVVRHYLTCGDLKNGFARVRCRDCRDEYLLAFSCKGRWFCPSLAQTWSPVSIERDSFLSNKPKSSFQNGVSRACHAKKVLQFGESLRDNILYSVPHRQYVFTIPIVCRLYFKYDRRLLTRLCHCAYESLLLFLRNTIGLTDGRPGVVLSIHSFGDYPEKFYPHIHPVR